MTYSVPQEADSKQAAEDAQRASDLVKKEHDAQLEVKDEAIDLVKKEHDAQLKAKDDSYAAVMMEVVELKSAKVVI